MKTESNPTSSARHEKPSNLPGANCSADALYPSLITANLLAGASKSAVADLDIDIYRTRVDPSSADAEAMVPVVEIYRLAGKQRPAKKGKRPCISE
jgi:hypothetical protein